MSNVILHIGLHKTATGTLQRQYFPACEDLKLFTTLEPEMRAFVRYVTRCDPIYFNVPKALGYLESTLDDRNLNLLSNESFSGPPYAGVIEGGLDHRSPILANLSAVFPGAKVMLVIRRQDSLAKSFYRQYLKSGGTRTIRRFYGLEKTKHLPLMSLDRFNFYPYVEALSNSFPAGLLILTFEEFVQNQNTFLTKLTDFIGIKAPDIELEKENTTTLGPFGMEVTRIMNHLFRSLLNPGGIIPGLKAKRFGKPARISPVEFIHDKWPTRGKKSTKGEIHRVAVHIFEMVQENNRNLDQNFKVGLKQYGYY